MELLGFSKSWTKKMRMVLREVPRIVTVKQPEQFSRKQYINYVGYLVRNYKNTDYRKQKLSALNKFLARHENYVYSSVTYKWEKHQPQKIIRLNDYQVGTVWAIPMDELERIVFWLLSTTGMRRIGILNLREQDIDLESGWIRICSKGGNGGKVRWVKIPPSGYYEISKYEEYREMVIEKELERDPNTIIPERWVIFWSKEKRPRLRCLNKTRYNDLVIKLSTVSDIYFRGHDMRRTQARKLYDCGVKVEIIKKILGHTKIETTLDYIGIHDDEIADALSRGDRYKDVVEGLYEK